MRLADLRRLAIRKQTAIRFRLRNGMECVVTPHGTATVPELNRVPDFNLEQELEAASEFLLEPAAGKDRTAQRLSSQELAALTSTARAAGATQEEE